MGLKLLFRRKSGRAKDRGRGAATTSASTTNTFTPAPVETLDTDPCRRLLQQGRLNMILREEDTWTSHPGGREVIQAAKRELESRMALVPAGSVVLSKTLGAQPGGDEEEVELEPFLLDVHAVTNSRFQKFVDAGGYDALEFWPEEIWPHLIELKDQTSQPAPRYWRNGRHDSRLANHPVIGVSWYEAQAYALWIGQRLPSEAEWQMAASWHIKSSTDMIRRFPWGDTMDARRCNIWLARHAGTVPVDEYPNGAAPNQVRQLVGNVWEWTDTEYMVTDDGNRPIVGEMPMHVIRGGAFDTYFENQCTNNFRTGQVALARAHNTGFRCAMDLSEARWINGQ